MFSLIQPDLFWSYVNRGAPGDCWLWTGRSRRGHKKQYGSYSVRVDRTHTKAFGAHRAAYALANNLPELPPGSVVQHTCDTPLCCNPAHLSLGTHQTNMADMWAKGRGSYGPRPGRFKSTITGKQRAEVRRLRATTALSQRAIGAAVGVSQMSVSNILRGVS